jgi:hypothetical protein
VFGRKKKEKDTIGVSCPYCEYMNPLGAQTCEQCYYELNKSARDQPMAEPTTTGDEIMDLLLGENEDPEEAPEVVQAVLAMDDVTVDIDQYAVVPPSEGEEDDVPATFDFIEGQGPTLSQTVLAEEEEEEELTAADAPKEHVEFTFEDIDPLAEVADPVHTGKGGLYSPTVATPNDDDLLGEVGPALTGGTPDLPDLPDDDDDEPTGSLAQAVVSEPLRESVSAPAEGDIASTEPSQAVSPTPAVPATPDLPDFFDDEEEAASGHGENEVVANAPAGGEEATPDEPATDPNRIWPWPKGEAWSPTQVYQEVVAALEHIKHRRMEQAAQTLDGLGPHLDVNLDMLLHISVLMQHLGRHDHVKWTLDMAAYVHPNDPHVQQARAQLLA